MTTTTYRIGFGLLLTILGANLAGCGGNPYFSDDEGGERTSADTGGNHPDELSLPYALGTEVNVVVRGVDDGDLASWTVKSGSSTVLSVDKVTFDDQGHTLAAACTARAEGTARLQLFDAGGAERRAADVSVRAPSRVRVFSHGSLRVLGRESSSFDAAEVTSARVVAAGVGVYGVAYFAGAERVYGRGLLDVGKPPAGVKLEDKTTSGVALNEWLFVTPAAPGDSTIDLTHKSGIALGKLPLSAVAPNVVTKFELAEEQQKEPKDGDDVWVLARSRDDQSRVVDGVYFQWTLDGAPQGGKDSPAEVKAGDLFRYKRAAARAGRALAAKQGGVTVASTTIAAEKGYVETTEYLGCALGGRRGAGGSVAFALALAALGTVIGRARRRRHPR